MRLGMPESRGGQVATVVSAVVLGAVGMFGIERGVDALDPVPRLGSTATRMHNVDVEGCAAVLLLDREQRVSATPKLCADFNGNFTHIYRHVNSYATKGPDDDSQDDGSLVSETTSATVVLPRKLGFVDRNLITARSIEHDKAQQTSYDDRALILGGAIGLLGGFVLLGDLQFRRRRAELEA